MAKPKISLKLGLMMTIVICWLVPIIIIVTLAGVLFGDNYRRSVQQEIAASAEYALRQVRLQLEDVVNDSQNHVLRRHRPQRLPQLSAER